MKGARQRQRVHPLSSSGGQRARPPTWKNSQRKLHNTEKVHSVKSVLVPSCGASLVVLCACDGREISLLHSAFAPSCIGQRRKFAVRVRCSLQSTPFLSYSLSHLTAATSGILRLCASQKLSSWALALTTLGSCERAQHRRLSRLPPAEGRHSSNGLGANFHLLCERQARRMVLAAAQLDDDDEPDNQIPPPSPSRRLPNEKHTHTQCRLMEANNNCYSKSLFSVPLPHTLTQSGTSDLVLKAIISSSNLTD